MRNPYKILLILMSVLISTLIINYFLRFFLLFRRSILSGNFSPIEIDYVMLQKTSILFIPIWMTVILGCIFVCGRLLYRKLAIANPAHLFLMATLTMVFIFNREIVEVFLYNLDYKEFQISISEYIEYYCGIESKFCQIKYFTYNIMASALNGLIYTLVFGTIMKLGQKMYEKVHA